MAVVAVLEELKGVEHVVDMMLTDESVKELPASDVAYRAVAPDLLRGLDDKLLALVVKAYIHMPLLVEAVEYASRPPLVEDARPVDSPPTSQINSKPARRISLPRSKGSPII